MVDAAIRFVVLLLLPLLLYCSLLLWHLGRLPPTRRCLGTQPPPPKGAENGKGSPFFPLGEGNRRGGR